MRFRIGGTLLDNNVTRFVRRAQAITNARGVPIRLRWTYSVQVLLASFASGSTARQVDFSRQEYLLRQMLTARNVEFAFHCDDGTPTDAVLSPIGSISGTDVFEVGNPQEGRGEYVGQRTMAFVVAATYPVGDPRGVLVDFKESLAFQGDGAPPWNEYVGRLGSVVRIYEALKSACFAYQFGTAIGHLDWPAFGGPHGAPLSFWPTSYKSELSRYVKGDPEGEGNTLVNFPISWNYTHVRFGSPFNGSPHLWR